MFLNVILKITKWENGVILENFDFRKWDTLGSGSVIMRSPEEWERLSGRRRRVSLEKKFELLPENKRVEV